MKSYRALNEMGQAKVLASGTFYLALMNAIQYVTAFIFYVVVARVLSPSEVGSFSLLLMIMAVFNTLTLLALNNAVIKYVSESLGGGDEEEAWACSRKALKLMLSVSVPALGVCILASPMLSSYVGAGSPEVSAMLLNRGSLSTSQSKAEVDKVVSRVDLLDESLFELSEKMEWIERSVSRRLRDDWIGYKYVDEEGYCTYWGLYSKVEGWDMREGFREGRVIYHLNVRKHPLICTACPSYERRGFCS